MDVVILSRIQFALNIAFHFIYPPLSIGIGLFLVIMEGLYLKTKNPQYEQLTKFWVKIFLIRRPVGSKKLIRSMHVGPIKRYSNLVTYLPASKQGTPLKSG